MWRLNQTGDLAEGDLVSSIVNDFALLLMDSN